MKESAKEKKSVGMKRESKFGEGQARSFFKNMMS